MRRLAIAVLIIGCGLAAYYDGPFGIMALFVAVPLLLALAAISAGWYRPVRWLTAISLALLVALAVFGYSTLIERALGG